LTQCNRQLSRGGSSPGHRRSMRAAGSAWGADSAAGGPFLAVIGSLRVALAAPAHREATSRAAVGLVVYGCHFVVLRCWLGGGDLGGGDPGGLGGLEGRRGDTLLHPERESVVNLYREGGREEGREGSTRRVEGGSETHNASKESSISQRRQTAR